MFEDRDIVQPAVLPVAMQLGISFFHDIIACEHKAHEYMEQWEKNDLAVLKVEF